MMIKLKDVQRITSLSRSSIYAYIDKGIFPTQVKLGARSVAWLESDIQSWVESKINARNAMNDEHFTNKIGDTNERV
jgi:prophage regulatory protein